MWLLFTVAQNVAKFYSEHNESDDRRRDPANGHCQTVVEASFTWAATPLLLPAEVARL